MLNSNQIKKIHDDGYLVIDAQIPKEVLNGLEREFYLTKDNVKSYSGWAFMGVFRNSEFMLNFIKKGPVKEIAMQLHDQENIDLYWDSVTVKAAHSAKEFCWHQDEGYTQTTPHGYYTFWIPFEDVNAHNGGIWVLPGSHKQGIVEHEFVSSSAETFPGQRVKNIDESSQREAPVKAGQILVFHSHLVHRSGANNSAKDRAAMAFALHKGGYKEIDVPSNLSPVPGLSV